MSGAFLPFLNNILGDPISFDFGCPEVCALNVSVHKCIGMPWPCGIYVTRKSLANKPKK